MDKALEAIERFHLNPRGVFSASTLLLAFAGIGIVILNAWANSNTAIRKLKLAKSIWKFEPAASALAVLRQQQAGWYKLLLAGLMIAALAVSVLVRFFPPSPSIAAGCALWLLWSAYLWYYWFAFVVATDKATTAAANDPAAAPPAASTDAGVTSWSKRVKDEKQAEDKRLPVTIVTGFLGSGKTTLVKRILHNTVGMKVMVIENEIGSEGIDHELLMQHTAKEEIVLMNNGCICCNGTCPHTPPTALLLSHRSHRSHRAGCVSVVRSDLLSTFRKMFTNEAFALLDWIVIETTGLADPAPLIQSFYMDSECQKRMRLDCVLTVVDSKHLPIHLAQHQYDEVRRKSGLPTGGSGGGSSSGGSGGSGGSGAHGGVPEAVLQISFADKVVLNKTDLVTPRDVQKLTHQIGELNPYAAVMTCQYGHVDIRELLNVKAFDPKRFTSTLTAQHQDGAASSFDRPILIQRDAQGKILKKQVRVDFSGRFHDAKDIATTSSAQQVKRDAQQIRTVSLVTDEALDFDAFNVWISQVLQSQGPNIYRLKGILHMQGYDEQFVCHGVHMIFEGDRGSRWPVAATQRRSRLVVIGKDLNQTEWESGFASTFSVHTSR